MSRDDGITSFDDDEGDGPSASFSEGPVSGGPVPGARSPGTRGGDDRRRRSRGISPGSSGRSKPAKRSVGPLKLDIRSIRGAATSMLTISVAGVLAVVCILYFTVYRESGYEFYGALAAAMVVMLLIGYIGARLTGVKE